ncbi:NAD(+) diphosphatase [Roseovarius aestuariivivens]|uniref:NAD(+) diphosphatase n=1 Tax=Roseovarius aestuariivivens TaxID=1888910 RepID=UPI0010800E96|nr:NAD(+) diphosphatase [Roseovarius aestuariivivens]
MDHAETVTFGGSGLDRAAELRGDPEEIVTRISEGRAETVVLWQGKPLVTGAARDSLVRLAPDHPVVIEAGGAPLLLGRGEAGKIILAVELEAWSPPDLDQTQLNAFSDPTEQWYPGLPEDYVFAELRRIMTRLSPRDAELAATARALFTWHSTHGYCSRCGEKSEIVQAGWQSRCPACGGNHFPRTDPVVIMLITRANKVLLGRSPGWPDGMYSLLAGFVEPGETIEAAVRREVWEEAGIKVGQVGYLASQPWAFPASLMLGCHGVALSEEITIDPAEIEHAAWFSRDEIMQAFAGQHPLLNPARKGAIAQFLLRNWLADTLD